MNRATRGSVEYEANSCPHFTPKKQQSANSTVKQQTPRQQALQQQKEAIKQSQEQLQKQDQPITKPKIKSSDPQSIADTSSNNRIKSDEHENAVETNGDHENSKKSTVRKKSISAKEKKIRKQRTLSKMILPKNALMALNEVNGMQIGDFVVNSGKSGGFSALVTINQVEYEGRGSSKSAAKNSACEKALRDFVIAKMRQKPRRTSQSASEAMDTSESNEMGNDSDDGNSNDDTDVPMANLASFALHKLFSEWESEGYKMPENQPEKPPKIHVRAELPPNWKELHPATLLCLMRPGLAYSNWKTEGEKPNVIQTLSLVVDGEKFVGSGSSKKIARKNAAIAACNKMFDTNFSA